MERARPTKSATVAGCSRGGGAGAVRRGCRRRSGGRCRCSWVRWVPRRKRVLGDWGVAYRPPGSRAEVCPGAGGGPAAEARSGDSAAAGARWAQQLRQQQQQLQRAWAAPRDPAVRVEVSAKFASMPTRTPVHTRDVNLMSGMWAMFHLIRFISAAKGLCRSLRGHMAHNRAHKPRRDPVIHADPCDPHVIRFASSSALERDRTPERPPSYRSCAEAELRPGPYSAVRVYADLNTFRIALVPQSE